MLQTFFRNFFRNFKIVRVDEISCATEHTKIHCLVKDLFSETIVNLISEPYITLSVKTIRNLYWRIIITIEKHLPLCIR